MSFTDLIPGQNAALASATANYDRLVSGSQHRDFVYSILDKWLYGVQLGR